MAAFGAVFLGAFLAFLAGIAAQEIVQGLRHRSYRRLARNAIATELVHNLGVIDSMRSSAIQTRDEGFIAIHSPIATLRGGMLQQLTSSEWFEALLPSERLFLQDAVGKLDRATAQFTSWEEAVVPGIGLTTIIVEETKARTTYRELATEKLLDVLGKIQTNLLDLLILVCNHSKLGGFTDEEAATVQGKLLPTRKGWPKRARLVRWYRSSELKNLIGGESTDVKTRYEHLVVWEDDWPDCPMPVIELRAKNTEPEWQFKGRNTA